MSDIRKKPEQIDVPTDPISGPAFITPRRKPPSDKTPPLGKTTDKPYEQEG